MIFHIIISTIKSQVYSMLLHLGIPSSDGIPYNLADFFVFFVHFFFRRPCGGHLLCIKQWIGLKFCRTILMGMLQVKMVLVRSLFIELFE